MKFTNSFQSSIAILAVATLGLSPLSAVAATPATTTFAVTATVQATCVVSATGVAFGTYTGVVVNTISSTVTVQCTNTTPYTVGLNQGAASGASVTNRSMTGTGGALLNYGLYSDAGRSANFATTASITGNGSTQPITVYGLVPAGQYVAPGSYTDTITATVTY
jgi:spore coat protein U-like protein